jgi:RsiW-degrading membrane proteinase PrsW (M82 family)
VTVGALAWGGTVAMWFAMKANSAVGDIFSLWFSSDFSDDWGNAIAAATNEETLKALGVAVIVLLPLTRVRSTLDGWYYGMMVGLGFQIVEDYAYTVREAASLAEVNTFLFQRGLLAGLWAHAVYTGIVGAGIGFLVTRTDRPLVRRVLVAVGFFALAWFFHFLWDLPVINEMFGTGFGGFVAVILLKGVPALVTLLLVVRWARTYERSEWTAFVERCVDPSLLTPQEATDLLSRKQRTAARKASAAQGGHQAKGLRKRLQVTQLRYVQAVREEGPTSTAALAEADLIRRIRQDPAFV